MPSPDKYAIKRDAMIKESLALSQIYAAEIVTEILRDNPSFGVAELQQRLNEIATAAKQQRREMNRREWADCHFCGGEIFRYASLAADPEAWRHDDEYTSRSCRSASYDSATGYDDSIPASRKAKPKPGTIRSEEEV